MGHQRDTTGDIMIVPPKEGNRVARRWRKCRERFIKGRLPLAVIYPFPTSPFPQLNALAGHVSLVHWTLYIDLPYDHGFQLPSLEDAIFQSRALLDSWIAMTGTANHGMLSTWTTPTNATWRPLSPDGGQKEHLVFFY